MKHLLVPLVIVLFAPLASAEGDLMEQWTLVSVDDETGEDISMVDWQWYTPPTFGHESGCWDKQSCGRKVDDFCEARGRKTKSASLRHTRNEDGTWNEECIGECTGSQPTFHLWAICARKRPPKPPDVTGFGIQDGPDPISERCPPGQFCVQ